MIHKLVYMYNLIGRQTNTHVTSGNTKNFNKFYLLIQYINC